MEKKITTEMYVQEFSVENNPYYPDVDYVVVSPSGDDEVLQSFIHEFMLNDTQTSFPNGFIIPKKTFDTVLLPLFKEIDAHNKAVIEEKKEEEHVEKLIKEDIPFSVDTPLDKWNQLWCYCEAFGNPFVCDDDRMEVSIMIGPVRIALKVTDEGRYEVTSRKFTAIGRIGFTEKLYTEDKVYPYEMQARARFYTLIQAYSDKMLFGKITLDGTEVVL